MSPGFAAAAFVAAIVALFVIAPLLRSPAKRPGDDATRLDNLGEARDLQSRQDMLLGSLKDLEDDHATDKVGESDFRRMHDRLSREAIEVMQRLDELEGERTEADRKAAKPLRHPAADR